MVCFGILFYVNCSAIKITFLALIAKELPQESSRFARVDRTYMRTMKKAVEVRNVMQV